MSPGKLGRFVAAVRGVLTLGLIMFAVFAAALFAARTIIRYQDEAHREHNAGKILTELDSILTGEQARNAVVINRGRLTEDEVRGFEGFRVTIRDLLRNLETEKPADDTALRVRAHTEEYWAGIDQLMRVVLDGRISEARAGMAALVGPPHDARMAIVADAKTRFNDQAAASEENAAYVTLMITVGGALCVSALFLAVSRQRTASQLGKLKTRVLEESEARFRTLIQNAASVITVVNESGDIQYQSATVQAALGYKPTDLLHASFASIVHADDQPAFASMMRRTLQAGGRAETIELRLQSHTGDWVETEVVAQNLTSDAHIRGVVLTARDIRERKTLENQLARQALHDPLTGLPNRLLFRDRLGQALQRGNRAGKRHSVMFLDLDDFKLVNDSMGHLAGDEYLISVSERLSLMVRSRDTVARFGGDEFAVLLENTTHAELSSISSRIMESFSEPFVVDGRPIQATASVGIVSADGPRDPDELLRDADTAMYIAKARGKGRCEVFTPAMHAAVVDRMDLERDLREGLAKGQFQVYYQPMVGFDSDILTGMEALLRWEHPRRGLLLPGQFISIAEETGLIVPLGEVVLRQACRQVAAWQKQYDREIVLTVNLSARQFSDPELVEKVQRALDDSGFPARDLVLEITETILAQSSPALLQRLDDLRALGLRLAIDDFGTGYSSLSYLQDFPVDIVKIDKSFIDGLNGDEGSAALPEAIVSLARALNLKTVAEGVERSEQVTALSLMGCDLWQGYFFAHPLNEAGIEKLLDQPSRAARHARNGLKLAS